MYTNIKNNFNYWPKLGSKIMVAYSAFMLISNIPVLFSVLSQGIGPATIGTLAYSLIGLLFSIILFFYFLKTLKAQSTLKNAYMGKIMRKKLNYPDGQIEAALAQIDAEAAAPVYIDTNTKNTFMITKNWVIGGTGNLMRALAVKISDIKKYERLIVENRRGSTSYGFYLVITINPGDEFRIRLGSSELMDEAACELAAAIKNTTEQPTL